MAILSRAYASYAFTDVAAIYTTPSSPMAELVDEMAHREPRMHW